MAAMGKQVVATDMDPACIDKLYRSSSDPRITSLVMDLMKPTPCQSSRIRAWQNDEPQSE